MDSQHRHELQTNDLSKISAQVQPIMEKYGNQLAIAVCAVCLVLAAYIYWSRSSSAKNAGAWASLATAQTPSELKELARDYASTTAAPWAKLKEGERRLSSGVQLMFTNREAALLELKDARDAFQGLASNARNPDAVRERALFGLARTLETLANGDLSPSIKAYEQLLADYPGGIYEPFAKQRLEELQRPGAASFYTWFATLNPKPDLDQKPSDRPIGDDDTPVRLPPLKGGGLEGLLGPSLNPPTLPPTTPDATTTPADGTTPSEGTPGDSAESPSSPAPETKPEPDSKPSDEPAPQEPSPEKSDAPKPETPS